MKHLLFLLMLFFWLIPEQGKGQITIHPEVGVSYLSFNLHQTWYINNPRLLDPIFGVSAHLPLSPDWFIKSKITFSKRDEKIFNGRGFLSNYKVYNQSDLNVEFSVNYRVLRFVEIGLGPSIIRSMAETKTVYRSPSNAISFYNNNNFLLGLNTSGSVVFGKFRLHLTYTKIFKEIIYSDFRTGKNRLDLTVSYHLFGGDKGKKR